MRNTIAFFIGLVCSSYAWVWLLQCEADASDISVRGAIFWIGGMCLPCVTLGGVLLAFALMEAMDLIIGRWR